MAVRRPGENVFEPARRKPKKNNVQRQKGGALSVTTQNYQKLRATQKQVSGSLSH